MSNSNRGWMIMTGSNSLWKLRESFLSSPLVWQCVNHRACPTEGMQPRTAAFSRRYLEASPKYVTFSLPAEVITVFLPTINPFHRQFSRSLVESPQSMCFGWSIFSTGKSHSSEPSRSRPNDPTKNTNHRSWRYQVGH